RHFMNRPADQREARQLLAEALAHEAGADRWAIFNRLSVTLVRRAGGQTPAQRRGLAYCILAHEVDEIVRTTPDGTAVRADARA
ncbi:hypothetical protein, partial [Vibrio parahaemolyticus]|uniref:hypothetical protein n=1 Tax=Vibrio parahaemolyticus TaxID=670 RepID=UPI0021119124